MRSITLRASANHLIMAIFAVNAIMSTLSLVLLASVVIAPMIPHIIQNLLSSLAFK